MKPTGIKYYGPLTSINLYPFPHRICLINQHGCNIYSSLISSGHHKQKRTTYPMMPQLWSQFTKLKSWDPSKNKIIIFVKYSFSF